MGFSINGLILALLIFLPSFIMIIFPPYNSPVIKQKPMFLFIILERIGQTSCLLILIISKTSFQNQHVNLWFLLSVICIIYYYGLWIRYIIKGRDFALLYNPVIIPIPMAVLPVLVFIFLAIWGTSLWLGLACLIFATGHIIISWKTFKNISIRSK